MAIVRTGETAAIPDLVEALVLAGITTVEVALVGPGSMVGIRQALRRGIPDLVLGAGTVLGLEDAGAVLDEGVSYIVAPVLRAEVVSYALRRGAAAFPGAFTPTEVFAASQTGATAVKLFPARVGGPRYVSTLLGPFPHALLVPTGGITSEDGPAYLRAGAAAIAVGSPLLQDAARTGDMVALGTRARSLVHAVANAEPP